MVAARVINAMKRVCKLDTRGWCRADGIVQVTFVCFLNIGVRHETGSNDRGLDSRPQQNISDREPVSSV